MKPTQDWQKHGRKKPYTEIGIERLPCFRCGHPAYHQWQICADNNLYRPLCLECDIALNKLVLEWFGFENVDKKIKTYKEGFYE